MIQTYWVEVCKPPKADGMGGLLPADWETATRIDGYLDMQTGTNRSFMTMPAIVEESTHVLIVPKYSDALMAVLDTSPEVRISETGSVDQPGRRYLVLLADDPVGVHHHLEIYLKLQQGGGGN